MKKIVIFNVGGASSAYIEIDDIKVLIDLGSGNNFSPVNDFLIPISQNRNYLKDNSGKYRWINQLFLTHLDNDHVSDFVELNKDFIPELLTVPNDHQAIHENLRVNRDKIPKNDAAELILNDMRLRSPGRYFNQPDVDRPLTVYNSDIFSLFYISPKECEIIDNTGDGEYPYYCNNISLITIVKVGAYRILFPGDMMSNGMEYLINNNTGFKETLMIDGVDFLIAPHHGINTAFPQSLFNIIKNSKVKLTIISEKEIEKSESENRHDVDKRYYQPEFSSGYIVSGVSQNAIITSKHIIGHILIDFDSIYPTIKRCTTEELLKIF